MLIGLDSHGQVFDYYYPYVGLENHTSGKYIHKIGLWSDNELDWIDGPNFKVNVNFETDTFASKIIAENPSKKITLEFNDILYNEKNIFIREVKVFNHADKSREVKLFFNHQFEIYESFRGDTAYYDPEKHVIIHYKGRRIFLMNLMDANSGISFEDFSCGLLAMEGKEGTYKDAEDGVLSKNPIEHGLVDSVMGITLRLKPNYFKTVHYWSCASKEMKEVFQLNDYVILKTPKYLLNTSKNYWKAWVNKENFNFYGLDKEIIDLFKKSLYVIRGHVDNDGGIIASSDTDLLKYGRDNYSYVWPRDSAFTVMALNKAGFTDVSKRFFLFANEIIRDEGFFMHKYRSDRSLGSSWHPWLRDNKLELPIQEDETALVIIALWDYYTKTRHIEFIEEVYNSLIKKAAEFMASYIDERTGLPRPSYDLWEEKFGVNTFTSSAVYGALICASRFAEILGKEKSAEYYKKTAEQIKKSILYFLYDEDKNYFYKLLNNKTGKIEFDETLDMSSFYALFKFNILDLNDERLQNMFYKIKHELECKTAIGGIPRYSNDNYFRNNETGIGNPWNITTLWMAQYYVRTANSAQDLEKVKDILHFVKKHSSNSGMISEQLNPITGEQISATPLVWSHSEFVVTILEYLEKLEKLGVCKMCLPVE